MKKGFCVGIFGGSFNPPHIGHIRAAHNFCRAANIDLLMVIPSFIPPHKEISGIDPYKRLEMARLAFSGISSNVEISDCEIKRGGKSYTLYTVLEIKERYPECQIALFVGSDMLMSFDTWHKASELFKMCTLYVMSRFDDRAELEQKAQHYREAYGARIVFIEGEFHEISSTILREASKEDNAGLLKKHLTENVLDYIKRERLYGKE